MPWCSRWAREAFGPEGTFKLDPFTVTLAHSNAVAAMLSGNNEIDLHFTGPPFSEIELRDPKIKTILNSDDVMGGSTSFTVLYTTRKFHDANPMLYKAFLNALKEATDYINADKRRAAEIYLSTLSGTRETIENILPMFEDKRNIFTVAPQNVMKYADFMHSIQLIRSKPESWKDLFLPDIHDVSGS